MPTTSVLLLQQQQPASLPSYSSCSPSPAAIASARRGNSVLLMRHARSKLCRRNQFCILLEFKKQTFKMIERLKVAEDDSNSSGMISSAESAPTNTPANSKAQVKPTKEKGQLTAIITGVIAVLLGLGYLLVVQLLDTRGVILISPPPEAFEP